jgi:hypothetical protein
MDSRVHKYVSGYEVSHRIEAPQHNSHGMNMPWEAPSRQWEGLMMDFVISFPESTALYHTGILVIVDRLTQRAIYLPCRKDIVLLELARLCFEHLMCKRDVPDNIVTDCGTQFTS